MEEDNAKPRYWLSDGVKLHQGVSYEDYTINYKCDDCYIDTCCKYLFGLFCVAFVKHYFTGNSMLLPSGIHMSNTSVLLTGSWTCTCTSTAMSNRSGLLSLTNPPNV